MQDLQLQLTEPHERVLELRIGGEIDMATAPPVRDVAHAAVASGAYDSLVIDLLGVEFIDSSGLHALLDTHKAMAATGGTTKVVCASRNLRRVFELTGLDRVLTIVDDLPQAYAAATV